MDSGETIFYPRSIHNLSKFRIFNFNLGADFGDLVKSRSVNHLRPQSTDIEFKPLGLDTFGKIIRLISVVKSHNKVQKMLKYKHQHTGRRNNLPRYTTPQFMIEGDRIDLPESERRREEGSQTSAVKRREK